MVLAFYLNDTAALLRDPYYSFTTQAQMTRWINDARRELAQRTGCVRRLVTGQSPFGSVSQPGVLIPGVMQPGNLPGGGAAGAAGNVGGGFSSGFSSGFSIGSATSVGGSVMQNACATVPGVERYPFEGFFNTFLQQQYPGCESILDVLTCSVNWGGTNRPSLDWWPWDQFQAWARAYAVLNSSYPSIWSVFNDGPMGEIYMFPVPSTVGEIELDTYALPSDLYSDSDPEVIPAGFRKPVKYGAAKLCYLASQRFEQAQLMESLFADSAGIARVSVDTGKVPSYYFRTI